MMYSTSSPHFRVRPFSSCQEQFRRFRNQEEFHELTHCKFLCATTLRYPRVTIINYHKHALQYPNSYQMEKPRWCTKDKFEENILTISCIQIKTANAKYNLLYFLFMCTSHNIPSTKCALDRESILHDHSFWKWQQDQVLANRQPLSHNNNNNFRWLWTKIIWQVLRIQNNFHFIF